MDYGFETLQLHAGQYPDSETHARAMPIYQTTSYCYENAAQAAGVFSGTGEGYTYSRIENPTVVALEKRMTALEKGKATIAFASGMAAISAAIYSLCGHGDHIVAISTLYGGTYTLLNASLPHWSNIHTTFVNPDHLAEMEQAINERTKIIYLETICNPNINIPDFTSIKKLAVKYGIPLVIDNTFGIPPIFDAKKHGADIVIHSLSKYAGGHGTTIGGCVVDMGTFDFHSDRFADMNVPDPQCGNIIYADQEAPIAKRLYCQVIRNLGGCLSPFSAFQIMQGIETLSLRVKKHCENAHAVAKFLQSHKNVAYVHYPMLEKDHYHERALKYLPNGAGAILSFGVIGGIEEGRKFIDGLKLFSLLANVADAKSLVIHPASTTHSQMNQEEWKAAGVAPELIRLSIGLEDIHDLLADLERGLDF